MRMSWPWSSSVSRHCTYPQHKSQRDHLVSSSSVFFDEVGVWPIPRAPTIRRHIWYIRCGSWYTPWTDAKMFQKMMSEFSSADNAATADLGRLIVIYVILSNWMVRWGKVEVHATYLKCNTHDIVCGPTAAKRSYIDSVSKQASLENREDMLEDATVGRLSCFMKALLHSIHPAMVINIHRDNPDLTGHSKKQWKNMIPPSFEEEEYRVRDSSRSCKVLDLIQHVRDNGKKTVVFSPFVKVPDLIEHERKEAPFSPEEELDLFRIDRVLVLNSQSRLEIIKKFCDSPPGSILLASIGALGEGHTVQCATSVIFVRLTWTPSNEYLVWCCTGRHGQKEIVDVYFARVQNLHWQSMRRLLQ